MPRRTTVSFGAFHHGELLLGVQIFECTKLSLAAGQESLRKLPKAYTKLGSTARQKLLMPLQLKKLKSSFDGRTFSGETKGKLKCS